MTKHSACNLEKHWLEEEVGQCIFFPIDEDAILFNQHFKYVQCVMSQVKVLLSRKIHRKFYNLNNELLESLKDEVESILSGSERFDKTLKEENNSFWTCLQNQKHQ